MSTQNIEVICFMCNQSIELKSLRHHFSLFHRLNFVNGNCNHIFLCRNNDCNQVTSSFKSFKHHIISKHKAPLASYAHNIEAISQNQDSSRVQPGPPNIDDTLENEPVIHCDDIDPKSDVINIIQKSICELRSNSTVPESVLTNFIETYQKMNQAVFSYFNIKDEDSEFINKSLQHAKTFKGQQKVLSNNLDYVYSQKIVLGRRVESRISDGVNVLKTISDSFQYISIIGTLRNIILNDYLKNLIECENLRSTYGRIQSFIDCEMFKNSNYYSEHPNALRVNLYYDEIEVVNPIGSKTGIYKLGMFYFTLQNFPLHFNSNLNNIFVLMIVYYEDIKEYGWEKILEPLLNELKILESEEGFKFRLKNGEIFVLRAVLQSFSGDGQATNDIFGLLAAACNFFCRCCLISRNSLHNDGDQITYDVRTKAVHESHLQSIAEQTLHPRECGVRSESPLNSLRNFHTTTNYTFDYMHDLLEGVVGNELCKVLKHFIIDKRYFTIQYFNKRVARFRYGPNEYKNKPANNFTNNHFTTNNSTIKQRAVQTWVLLRAFPFLVGHLIPADSDDYMRLLMLLQKILEIITSYSISDYMITELRYLIFTHEFLFRKLFGNVFINKHHHLRHYADCILEKGPLIQFCVLRFEAKHLEGKRIIQNSKNFINLPLTLAKRYAFNQNINIKKQKYSKFEFKNNYCKTINMSQCLCEEIIKEQFPHLSQVDKLTEVLVNDIKFKKNYYLVLVDHEELHPSFLQVLEILKVDQNLYFYGNIFHTEMFNVKLNAFEIKTSNITKLIDIENVKLFKPLCPWYTFDEPDKKYMPMKEYYQ